MLKPLLFFAPGDQAARNAAQLLHRSRVDAHLIGLVADAGARLDEISMEDECQTWEALDVLQRSIALGGVLGNFAGLHAVSLPLASVTLAGAAIYASDFARRGFDSVLTHALGRSLTTELLADYHQKLVRGEWIMAVRLNGPHAAVVEDMFRQGEPLIHRESSLPGT